MATPTASEQPRIAPAVLARARRLGSAVGTPLGSVLFAFLVGAIIVALTGADPVLAYRELLCGGLGVLCGSNVYPALQISETLVYATPLVLTGLAVALGFRAGLFNIGAQGQMLAGAMATAILGVKLAGLPGFILLPLVLLAGALAGALWGGIVGVLKATTGAHEVVTTIMLNYVALYFLQYLIVGGPFELPNQSSISPSIAQGARLAPLISPSANVFGLPGGVYRVHSGLFLALVAAVVFWFLLRRTALGFELRAVGQSQRAARYAGVSVARTIIYTMLLSGAFAGLAGAVQIAGLRHNLTDIYSADTTGFDAIAVALLGQNTALGVVLAAVLFGALHVGGQYMQSSAGVSANLVAVMQALILFAIAANFLRTLRLRLPALGQRPPAAPEAEPPPVATTTSDDAARAATDTGSA